MGEISISEPHGAPVLTRREVLATAARTATYNTLASVPMVMPFVGLYAGIAGLLSSQDFSDSSLVFSAIILLFGALGSMVLGHISLGVERRPVTARNYQLTCLAVQMTASVVLLILIVSTTIVKPLVAQGFIYIQGPLLLGPILFLCGQITALTRMARIVRQSSSTTVKAIKPIKF
jgi:hypothetical protein